MMKILSLDPGLKNLSYCYLSIEGSEINILDWNNLCVTESNCKSITFDTLIEDLLQTLAAKFDDTFEANIVLIENQPLKNNKMKSVSIAIYTFFNMLKLYFGNIEKIQFVRATEKLKCAKYQELPTHLDKTTYKTRKLASIALCRLYLKDLCPEKLEWFDRQSKLDDNADTYNMCISYIENTLKHKI